MSERGNRRHPHPHPVAVGQESVWDYPRPPRVEASAEHVQVWFGGVLIADTTASLRVLETSHPPTCYLPEGAFVAGALRPTAGSTWCEFKGVASYFDVVGGDAAGAGGDAVAPRAAWAYPRPSPGFEALVGHVALMPGAMDRCLVDGEVVKPQAGGFYGGWITSRVVGPFKGEPGTRGW